MTTYARIVDGRALDVYRIPARLPSWAATEAELLARVFPGIAGFIVVPDDCKPGSTDNGDGTYSDPAVAKPTVYAVLTRQDFRAHAVKILGGNAIGTVKVQSYLDVAAANAGTQNADKLMRYALVAVRDNTTFTRDDADQIMQALGFSAQDRNAVTAAWPTV